MQNKNIFISYIEENHEVAKKIWDELTKQGAIPWAYKVNGSNNWKTQVVRELKKCDIMILVFCKKTDSKADKQIVNEVGLASQYNKEIIPFMLEDIAPEDITTERIVYDVVGSNTTWVNKEEPLEEQIKTLVCRIHKYYGEECNTSNISHINKEIKSNNNKRKSFNWKKLLLIVSIPLIFGLLYLGYKNFYQNNSLGTSLKLENLNHKQLTANEDPSNYPTLSVSNRAGINNWSYEVSIDDTSNLLTIQIHYYAWYHGAKHLRAYMDSLDGKMFQKNKNIYIEGSVKADNLEESKGKVKVFFRKKVKLRLSSISWQKNKCQSVECESKFLEKESNLFSKEGLYLGNIPRKSDRDYYANLIINYDVINID